MSESQDRENQRRRTISARRLSRRINSVNILRGAFTTFVGELIRPHLPQPSEQSVARNPGTTRTIWLSGARTGEQIVAPVHNITGDRIRMFPASHRSGSGMTSGVNSYSSTDDIAHVRSTLPSAEYVSAISDGIINILQTYRRDSDTFFELPAHSYEGYQRDGDDIDEIPIHAWPSSHIGRPYIDDVAPPLEPVDDKKHPMYEWTPKNVRAARQFTFKYMLHAIMNHEYMKKIASGDFIKTPPKICYNMASHVVDTREMVDVIMDLIHPAMLVHMADSINEAKNSSEKRLTDFEIICSVAAKREWLTECEICYNDMQSGEIVVFRPCGHVICVMCDERLDDRRCPMCRTPIEDTVMIRPYILPDHIRYSIDEAMKTYDEIKKLYDDSESLQSDGSLYEFVRAQMKVSFNGQFDCEDNCKAREVDELIEEYSVSSSEDEEIPRNSPRLHFAGMIEDVD